MKYRLALTISFCVGVLFASDASAQNWVKIYQFPPLGTNNQPWITCSWFFSPDTGLVAFSANYSSSTGVIKMTVDGGKSWTNCISPTYNNVVLYVTDIWFKDRDTGWLTIDGKAHGRLNTTDPTLWQTTDGGKTWNALINYLGKGPTGVRATDAALVVTEATGFGVAYSTDRGITWTPKATAKNGVEFDGARGVVTECWGVDKSTTFLYSPDGGLNWYNSNGIQHEAYAAYAVKHTGIFLAVPEDTTLPLSGNAIPSPVLYSKDYGRDWFQGTTLGINTTGAVQGVEGTIYVQSSGAPALTRGQGLYRSVDSGVTWVPVGGPDQGIGTFGQTDTRFSVTGCGNIVYASDDKGGLYKTTVAGDGKALGQCSFFPDTVKGSITSTICDTNKRTFYIHNRNISTIIVEGLTIVDSTRRPAKTGAVIIDSTDESFEPTIFAGDSLGFRVKWHPGFMMDSTANDSTLVRVIFRASYLEKYGLNPYDTIYIHIKLFGTSSPAEFTFAPRTLKKDSVLFCTPLDSILTLINIGCDTLRITKAQLIQKTWSLYDSTGKAFTSALLLAGDSVKLKIHATPTTSKVLFDSVRVTMHYQGRDTAFGVGMRTTAAFNPNLPLLSPQSANFGEVATCATSDTVLMLVNTACADMTIFKVDSASPFFWTLFDTSGNALKLPLTIKQSDSTPIKVRFTPRTLGQKSGTLKLHYHISDFDSSNVIAFSGDGSTSGALLYAKAYNFGAVSICSDTTLQIAFKNTSCDSALIDSLSMPPGFTLIDSSLLDHWISVSHNTIAFRVQYKPSKKEPQDGVVYLKAAINDGSQIVYDTLTVSGSGTAGTGIFQTAQLVPANFIFKERTECDEGDSASFTIDNPGCDTIWVQSITLDSTLPIAFQAHADQSLPEMIAPNSSGAKITVAIANLLAGTYAGKVHIVYKTPDGLTHDTIVTAAAVNITKGAGGGAAMQVLSESTLDFPTFAVCSSADTTIDVKNTGCGSLVIHNTITSGSGFLLAIPTGDSIVIPPNSTGHIHVVYDGTSSGPLSVTVTSAPTAATIKPFTTTITGNTSPSDSVKFNLTLSKNPVKTAESFRVLLTPDHAVSGKNLRSISGVFVYNRDAFTVGVGALSAGALPFTTDGPQDFGKLEHYNFHIDNPSDISLDPNVPVLTLGMTAMVTDTVGGAIALDSLVLNGNDPNFSKCVLSWKATTLIAKVTLQCGDSSLSRFLQGSPVVVGTHPHPNPLTADGGYKALFDVTSAEDAVAQVTVMDALGRVVSQSSIALKSGETSPYTMDLHNEPAGTYFYMVRLTGTRTPAALEGTFILLK